MRDFHPKMKGNLGEAKVAAELIRNGYPVFMEFGDLSRVDAIRDRGGGGGEVREDVDLFAVYVYDRDVLLYIPSPVICARRRHTSFRLDPARNAQEAGIRAASDFVDFEAALRKIGIHAPVA